MNASIFLLVATIVAPMLLMLVQMWFINRTTKAVIEHHQRMSDSNMTELRWIIAHYRTLSRTETAAKTTESQPTNQGGQHVER